ncbi:hypothetical protein [Caproiciproducens galactitolivorans]|uniref:SpoVT-AbrB domain-containing protein n=1 Tax=Caproiciproducens galactitolivorans TaxID=642589 RepID=A0ABT4BR68_9FIRM|nr:hypothetical protein [Caproiciproducens galactitolivorans]MCY1713379.1 hypothetical protein [Caproiciproducens galactitolivorans]
MNEIIGLPAIVSARYRIVIDKNLRNLFNIPETGSVLVRVTRNRLQIFPASRLVGGAVQKSISIGRFNLPMEWVRRNGVEIGSHVFLIATDDCILVCPSVKKQKIEGKEKK